MIYSIQKASLTKRISAFLFDVMMIIVVFLVCALSMSAILGYSNYTQEKDMIQASILEKYNIEALEEKYSDIEVANFIYYNNLSDEERVAFESNEDLPEELRKNFKDCLYEINNNEKIATLTGTMFSLFITIFSTSLLIAFIILEFIVPLIFKNGQTLGKKIFSLGVVRIDSVKVSPIVLFVRTILGKYTISTMVPLISFCWFTLFPSITPLFFILLILLLHIVFYFTSGTGALIHDKMAATAVVDMQTQMIFDSVEALEEYKLQVHREEAEKADY